MNKESNKVLGIYNEKSLNVLNIKELRVMGKKLGVPAPSIYKKEELISYILKIVYGEIDAASPTGFGRPSVREFDMDKFMKKIEKNSIVSPEDAMYGYGKVAAPSADYGEGDNIEQRVYIEEDGKCYLRKKGFVESLDDLEVESVYANKYSLENFDVLEILLFGDGFKILTINGIKVEDKFKGLELSGVQIKGGSKQDFRFSTKEEINANILKIKLTCESLNAKVFVFSKENYTSGNIFTTMYSEKDSSSNLYKKLMLFIGECQKAVFDGEDVVVVIDQTVAIEKAINSFENDVKMRTKKHLQSEFSKILSLGNVLIVYELDEDATY